jgi:hypothetical protein
LPPPFVVVSIMAPVLNRKTTEKKYSMDNSEKHKIAQAVFLI